MHDLKKNVIWPIIAAFITQTPWTLAEAHAQILTQNRSKISAAESNIYYGSLTQQDDRFAGAAADFFGLDAREDQVVKITCGRTDSSRLSCFQLYIFMPDAQQISANGRFGAECAFVVPADGRLYLAVTTFCSAGAAGDYYMEIEGTQTPLACITALEFTQAIYRDRRWLVQSNNMSWGDVPPQDENQKISPLGFNPGYLEYLILSRINAERSDKKLAGLEYHYSLNLAARQHSEEMAQLNYFNHVSPDPEYKTVHKRIIKAFNVNGKKFQELIDTMEKTSRNGDWDISYAALTVELIQKWKSSSTDRRQLLRKNMDYLGVGCAAVVSGDTLAFYITANFGKL